MLAKRNPNMARPFSRLDNNDQIERIAHQIQFTAVVGLNPKHMSESKHFPVHHDDDQPDKQNQSHNVVKVEQLKPLKNSQQGPVVRPHADITETAKKNEDFSLILKQQLLTELHSSEDEHGSDSGEEHHVVVDERDHRNAGKQRDSLEKRRESRVRRTSLGEDAYVPFGLDILREKIAEKGKKV